MIHAGAVWWAWTHYAWALNAANTDHPRVQLTTLLATAVGFMLAVGFHRATVIARTSCSWAGVSDFAYPYRNR